MSNKEKQHKLIERRPYLSPSIILCEGMAFSESLLSSSIVIDDYGDGGEGGWSAKSFGEFSSWEDEMWDPTEIEMSQNVQKTINF